MNPPAKKPRRRLWQFSLRTLGLLLCVCAALLWAWNHYVAPYRAQRQAIEQLQELGATIETEQGGLAWLRWLLGEEQFTTVVMVKLEQNKKIDDDDLSCLASLVDLRKLYLAGTPITDDGLKWVRHLKKLERLSLWDTRVTDAGLVHLRGLENLAVLDLHRNPVTNEGLAQLRRVAEADRPAFVPAIQARHVQHRERAGPVLAAAIELPGSGGADAHRDAGASPAGDPCGHRRAAGEATSQPGVAGAAGGARLACARQAALRGHPAARARGARRRGMAAARGEGVGPPPQLDPADSGGQAAGESAGPGVGQFHQRRRLSCGSRADFVAVGSGAADRLGG